MMMVNMKTTTLWVLALWKGNAVMGAITEDEVAEHDSKGDCWTAIEGTV